MGSEADDLIFRPFSRDDIGFIYSSWGSSFYKDFKRRKNITPKEFHSFHRPVIDRFFNRPNATVIICHGKDEPDVIIAWIAVEILEENISIHYAYIKHLFRRLGVLSKLIDIFDKEKPVIYTHQTDRFRRIISRNPDKYKRFTYVPQLT